MKTYNLVVRMINNERHVVIEDAHGKNCGRVEMTTAEKADPRSTYSLTNTDGDILILALKFQRFWDLNVGKFFVIHNSTTELIKETPGQNLILFRAEGNIDGSRLVVKETNDGNLKLLLEKKRIAYIKGLEGGRRAELSMDESIEENFKLFAICALIYFMYTQYLRKTTYLQDVLLSNNSEG